MTSYTPTRRRPVRVRSVVVGNGGWCRLNLAGDEEGPFVLVRVELGGIGRLRVVELYLRGDLSDYVLDGLPVRRIEDLLNGGRLSGVIRQRLELPRVDLETASGYFAGGAGRSDDNGRGVNWVDEMFLAQYPADVRGRPNGEGAVRSMAIERPNDGPFVVTGVIRPASAATNRTGAELLPPRRPGRPIEVPPTAPYGDDFYRVVAQVYRDACAWGTGKPAQVVRERCTRPVEMSQVYRWIRVARRRGFLTAAPGRGRASG